MKNGGATIWARKTIESDIFYWKPDKWFKIWFYVVNRANFEDTKLFPRGECFITYKEIIDGTGATKDQVKHCLEWMREATMIATRKTTRGMVLKVLKYCYYQTLDNYYSHTKSQTEAKQKPNRSHTISKKVKNDKNDKKTIKAKQSFAPEINPLIEKFKTINPSYTRFFANKTQRAALERLVKTHGLAKTQWAIEVLEETNGKRFAPTITTPLQLEDKLAQLIVFLKKTQSSGIAKIS